MIGVLVVLVVFGILLAAAKVDWDTGEVPEKLSMGLLSFVLAVSFIHSVALWRSSIILETVFWGLIALACSYVIFYFGQWGGGDVKVLAGIGCFLGYLDSTGYDWPFGTLFGIGIPALATYALNMVLLAAPFVLLYTVILGIRNPRVFVVYFRNMAKPKPLATLVISFIPIFFATYWGAHLLLAVYAFVPLMVLLSIYSKTVEDVLMSKSIPVSQLKDWDILADDVVADGVKIAPAGNIEGITPEQLAKVKELSALGKIPAVIRTKKGVEFVPVLFISVPVTLYVGNVLELFFRLLQGY
jgi:Flp pilus assembly protein protease CpaA